MLGETCIECKRTERPYGYNKNHVFICHKCRCVKADKFEYIVGQKKFDSLIENGLKNCQNQKEIMFINQMKESSSLPV